MATRTDFAPHFPVRIITGLRVSMRDGTELNVRITRPDAPGRFPAVLEYNPYRRLNEALPDYRDEYPPVVPYLAERGYVVVQFDVRGTGSSAGFSTDMYSDDERRDGHDMVEWCAAQDWCTGAVGMVGKSYGAVVQWQVAVQAPPHLRAIVVRSGGDDIYTEFSNPGGSIRPWMFEQYGPQMNAYNVAPPDPAFTGTRWAALWQERLDRSAPWSLGYIRNLQAGEYWGARSLAPGYDRVQCAVLLIEGWPDWYSTAELRTFQNLRGPKKVLIGPWGHYYPEESVALPGPRIDARREYLKWFDRWLKDIDNGVMDEPPVTVFVRSWQAPSLLTIEDAGTWCCESAWPPPHVRATDFFLDTNGRLASAPGEAGTDMYEYRPSVGLTTGRRGLGATTPWGTPVDQRLDDAYSVLYDGAPLTAPMELLGEPMVALSVSSTAEVAYFHVRLCDVAPDGASRLITDGGLLATHRHSHARPEKLVPGEVVELRFPLKHCAYALAPGHRLRVAVASAEFQNQWPTGERGHNTIHRGGARPSRVILPIAGAGAKLLPPPEFEPSPIPAKRADELPRPTYSMHLDFVADTVACELVNPDPIRRNHSLMTISNRNPAQASIISSLTYRPHHPTLDIEIESGCQLVSDAATYTHTVQLDIRIDGRPHFSKSWTECVPRGLS